MLDRRACIFRSPSHLQLVVHPQRKVEEQVDLDKTVVLDLFSQDIIHRILCL